jgi:aspartyl protease family protein
MMKHIIVTVLLLCLSSVSQAVSSVEVQALLGKKVVVQIDGVRRTLSIAKPSPEGVELISTNSDGATLKVNGKVKDYLLGSSVSMNYAKPENIEEKVFADDRGMFLRNGTINGRSVKFLVDTGATSIAMNSSQAKRLGIHYRLEGKPSTVSTASGFVKAYEVKLKTVGLGAIKQRNIRAMVIDGKHPGPILLGMTFLSGLKVDTKGDVMTLKKRK